MPSLFVKIFRYYLNKVSVETCQLLSTPGYYQPSAGGGNWHSGQPVPSLPHLPAAGFPNHCSSLCHPTAWRATLHDSTLLPCGQCLSPELLLQTTILKQGDSFGQAHLQQSFPPKSSCCSLQPKAALQLHFMFH